MFLLAKMQTDARRKLRREWYERNRDSIREYANALYAKMPHKAKARALSRRLRSPDAVAKANAEYCAKNPDRVRRYKRRYMLRTYGLSESKFVEMLSVQSNSCAICETNFADTKRGPCIDHDHESGKVRGLLCDLCNFAIGGLKDDPIIAIQAAAYLSAGALSRFDDLEAVE